MTSPLSNGVSSHDFINLHDVIVLLDDPASLLVTILCQVCRSLRLHLICYFAKQLGAGEACGGAWRAPQGGHVRYSCPSCLVNIAAQVGIFFLYHKYNLEAAVGLFQEVLSAPLYKRDQKYCYFSRLDINHTPLQIKMMHVYLYIQLHGRGANSHPSP